MAMDVKAFPYRLSPDKTRDSICPKCLRTIATKHRASDMESAEKSHICDPMDLLQMLAWTEETNVRVVPETEFATGCAD